MKKITKVLQPPPLLLPAKPQRRLVVTLEGQQDTHVGAATGENEIPEQDGHNEQIDERILFGSFFRAAGN